MHWIKKRFQAEPNTQRKYIEHVRILFAMYMNVWYMNVWCIYLHFVGFMVNAGKLQGMAGPSTGWNVIISNKNLYQAGTPPEV